MKLAVIQQSRANQGAREFRGDGWAALRTVNPLQFGIVNGTGGHPTVGDAAEHRSALPQPELRRQPVRDGQVTIEASINAGVELAGSEWASHPDSEHRAAQYIDVTDHTWMPSMSKVQS